MQLVDASAGGAPLSAATVRLPGGKAVLKARPPSTFDFIAIVREGLPVDVVDARGESQARAR